MDELDLGKLETTASATVADPVWVPVAVVAAMLVLLALCLASSGVAHRVGANRTWPRLATFPPSAKVGVSVGLLALLAVQAVAAAGVWMHTRVVHGSVGEYFFNISVPRLIGMSHAHLFGYAILYGLIGGIGTLTDASERTKALLIGTLLWSGIFDVASWWGIKMVSAKFELLSAMTAVTTATASLIILFLALRTLALKANA